MSGILLTCKSGALEGGKTRGVDKEFLALFSVLDENDSWLLDKNIKYYCSNPQGVNKEDEDFMESNKMHAINGYFYGNLPDLEMCLGDTVNWHLAGIGNEVDLHTGKIRVTFRPTEGNSRQSCILDSTPWIRDSLSVELGFWIQSFVGFRIL